MANKARHMIDGIPLREYAETYNIPYATLYYRHVIKAGVDKVQDGRTRHPLWDTWRMMHERCSYPGAINFKDYGARGIKVCDRWSGNPDGFWNFVNDMGERPEGFTVDRIDPLGPYSPENCRWADWTTQMRNRRDRKLEDYQGL